MRTALGLAATGLLLIGVAQAAQAIKAKRSTYSDAVYGFSFEAPRFPGAARAKPAMAVTVSGPAEGGFASNVNVVIQPRVPSRKAFRDQSLAQFKQLGLTLNSEQELTVSGRDALRLDYSGAIAGRELHFLALAVIDRDRTLLVTCTATPDAFKDAEPEFRACLDSFKLQ